MQGSKGDTDVKNRLLDSVGEGKGGMIWDNSIEICTLQYGKGTASESSMHKPGHLKPVLWDNPEKGGVGWETEGVDMDGADRSLGSYGSTL